VPASWLDAFQREILQFPNGRHDDQIDSLSQYLSWIKKRSDTDFQRVSFVVELVFAKAHWDLSGHSYGSTWDDNPFL
jgi:hypothetical protein